MEVDIKELNNIKDLLFEEGMTAEEYLIRKEFYGGLCFPEYQNDSDWSNEELFWWQHQIGNEKYRTIFDTWIDPDSELFKYSLLGLESIKSLTF